LQLPQQPPLTQLCRGCSVSTACIARSSNNSSIALAYILQKGHGCNTDCCMHTRSQRFQFPLLQRFPQLSQRWRQTALRRESQQSLAGKSSWRKTSGVAWAGSAEMDAAKHQAAVWPFKPLALRGMQYFKTPQPAGAKHHCIGMHHVRCFDFQKQVPHCAKMP